MRPGAVEFSAVSGHTVKEREEFAVASERAARLAKLNLCPSGLEDTATNDSLLVKVREAATALSESLSMLQPTVSWFSISLKYTATLKQTKTYFPKILLKSGSL